MAAPISQTRKNFPISRLLIFKRVVQATLLLVILLIVLYFSGILALDFDINLTAEIIGGLIVLIFLVAFFYEKAYFSSYFYDLTADYVIIKKDPIFPREITVPYDRITSVTIDRDIFDLLLGIWDLHINTNNSALLGMEPHIEGLRREAANGLQGVLMAQIKDQKK
ncbi:MAG TPA: PH domain-containing protein [Candidatus Paceibacterota bacterium]|nr:PH domain-containing protein [Candidatus Paceibacterota bacterium]